MPATRRLGDDRMLARFFDFIRLTSPGLAALALVLLPAAARADVIDGDWCATGRHLSIKGPEIVTPAGSRLQGNYTRHSFIYVVPPAEPEAGHTVAMLLINENTMNLRSGADAASAAQAPVQVWLRCAPPVSALEPPPRRPARSADS
jgi:hypothetical protein